MLKIVRIILVTFKDWNVNYSLLLISIINMVSMHQLVTIQLEVTKDKIYHNHLLLLFNPIEEIFISNFSYHKNSIYKDNRDNK